MNLNDVHNPYDFANPVIDTDLFAGRKKEIEDIKYYLDHACKASRAISLALIGERAAGKTSFLNMIDLLAQNRNLCVVRVDLDESNAVSQLSLFMKLFDNILSTACADGAYGGLDGKTYDIYRDIVDAYMVPSDKLFCPFSFPIQYAKAMSQNNTEAIVSDTIFKKDIGQIQKELNKNIIILIDEGNVLAQNKIHLQMIRNIFMNISGFMLVLTGTPELFPIINDVFSPVIRQFKKINISPFERIDETKDCITKPLLKVGIHDPSDIFDKETFNDISEIHNLTSGKPYEIQLICHFLFKRVQTNQDTKMKLTFEVLEDVLQELQANEDIFSRDIITKIRQLSKAQLTKLRILCAYDGTANFEQTWFLRYVFTDNIRWTKQELEKQMHEFIEIGVIKLNDDKISLNGDDFDKIYCKYLARKHGISVPMYGGRFELLMSIEFRTFIARKSQYISPYLSSSFGQIDKIDEDVVISILTEDGRRITELSLDLVDFLYWTTIENRNKVNFNMSIAFMKSPWGKARQIITGQTLQDETLSDILIEAIKSIQIKMQELGSDFSVDTITVPVIPLDILVNKIKDSGNKRLIDEITQSHTNKVYEYYIDKKDIDESMFHAGMANRYELLPMNLNNMAYINIVTKNFDEAERILEIAKTIPMEDCEIKALINYNISIVNIYKCDFEAAIESINKCIDEARQLDNDEVLMSTLLFPKKLDLETEYEFEEIPAPDILDLASNLLIFTQTEIDLLKDINQSQDHEDK